MVVSVKRLRAVLRIAPALAALVLLALAANAPRTARLGPAAPTYLQSGPCTQFVQSAPGDSLYVFGLSTGVSQPLVAGVAGAACSVSVQARGWSWLRLSMLDWDPLALTPDAHTIALRTQLLDPSDLQFYTINRTPRVNFVPPIVTHSLSGVADAPRATITAETVAPYTSFPSTFDATYDLSGSNDLPVAREVPAAGGSRPALPGAHPVLAHAICDAGGDLQQLSVVQAVVRTDEVLTGLPKELIQRFRVPERVELRWIELAVVPNDYQAYFLDATTVSIHDAASGTPPIALPPAYTTAFFMSYADGGGVNPPHWAGDLGLDHTILLEPGQDYWLRVSEARAMHYHARVLDGSESAAFTTDIGGLFTRDTSVAGWTARPARALSFKLIGKPVAPVGINPRPSSPSFALQVSPNPAASVADVRWSGAVGPVRIEVLDARGRRVASGQGGAAGSWSFARTGRGGQALSAGVYFVHARDSAGGHAVERVVLIP